MSTSLPSSSACSDSAITGADVHLCGICFCEVHPSENPRGTLNSCDHLFCLFCITTWAKDTNVCPHCKARFTRIVSVDAASGAETTLKVRRKNFRGWEESDEDDDDVTAAVRASVVCAVCRSGSNAARMLFCDRHTCQYVAHLDCLGMSDAPQTYVCTSCAGGTTSAPRTPTHPQASPDAARAEELALAAALACERAVVPPSPSVPPPPSPSQTSLQTVRTGPPPPVQVALAGPMLSGGAASGNDDDDVPYYLKGSNLAQAEIAQEQLQSRLDASAYEREMRRQRKHQRTPSTPAEAQAVATSGRGRGAESASNNGAAAAPVKEESIEDMEKRLLRVYFQEQLPVVRRRHYIKRNQLRLVGEGHVAMRQADRLEELHHEEQIRVEALHVAQQMVRDRMQGVRAAMRLSAEREVKRKATKEACALGKLAEMVALHRLKAKQAKEHAKQQQQQQQQQLTAGRQPRVAGSTIVPKVEKPEPTEVRVKLEPRDRP